MRLSHIEPSSNVLDLSAMLHLMPDQLQSALNYQFWSGVCIASGLILAIALALSLATNGKAKP